MNRIERAEAKEKPVRSVCQEIEAGESSPMRGFGWQAAL